MRKSERVALVCENSKECFTLMYQLWNDGKTVVFLDVFLPTETIIELLEKVKCSEIIIPDSETSLKSELEATGLDTEFYSETRDPAFRIQIEGINPDSKMIVFSSGTTSAAKAIVLSVEAVVRSAKRLSECIAVDTDGAAYIQSPVSHLWAICASMAFMFQNRQIEFGSLIKEKKQLEELKPTIYLSTPSVIEKRFSKHTGIDHYLCAGAVCSEKLEKMVRNAGKTIQNCYGLSEVAGVCAISAYDGPADKLFPVEKCSFDMCEDGTWICIDTLMEGYLGQDELNKRVLREDRVFISDIVRDNRDGTYSVLGRSDTVVALNNGIKIELESMDAQVKQIIEECDACVLYKDGKLVLVIDRPVSDIQQLINKFNEGQPYYSRIFDYKITGCPFPRTELGKLKRNILIEIVEGNC